MSGKAVGSFIGTPRAEVRVTFVIENRAGRSDLVAEFGLAILVERGGRAVLFDAGASAALLRNAAALNADLSRLDAIALSHGHDDHTGGLDSLMGVVPASTRIHAHPGALRCRYSIWPGAQPAEIGFRGGEEARRRVAVSDRPVELIPGVLLSGRIPRVNDFEDTGGPFFLDAGGKEPDAIDDTQALIVATGAGNVVISGCAHAGIVNTLTHASNVTGDGRFIAAVGGMFLKSAGTERVARTVRALREMGVERLGPAHGMGDVIRARLAGEFGDRFLDCVGGTVLDF